jgi:two-component system nitrogen regulation sensor histidine kinase GlnL
MGDEDHLQQAFQNIIRNAAEAAQEGGGSGQVTIRTAYATGLPSSGPGSALAFRGPCW